MNQNDRKEMKGLLGILGIIALIPVVLILTRPRPLSAASNQELVQLARDARQEEVLKEMSWRYEAESLSMEGHDPRNEPDYRWREIQRVLETKGPQPQEARQIVRAARVNLKDAWPCVVEPGYLKGQRVWLVIGSTPKATGFMGWVCTPSAQEIRRERVARLCSNTRAAIVSAEPPYLVLN